MCRNLSVPVGVEGFEPPTFCSQSRRTTRLCYTPSSVFLPGVSPRLAAFNPYGDAADETAVR